MYQNSTAGCVQRYRWSINICIISRCYDSVNVPCFITQQMGYQQAQYPMASQAPPSQPLNPMQTGTGTVQPGTGTMQQGISNPGGLTQAVSLFCLFVCRVHNSITTMYALLYWYIVYEVCAVWIMYGNNSYYCHIAVEQVYKHLRFH